MKLRILLFVALATVTTSTFAQSSVTKIMVKDEVYYLTNEIGRPITGVYKYQGGEPIVDLEEGGKGLFQLHGMSPTKILWGIECNEDGTPKKRESAAGAVYRLWYQIKEKHKGPTWESGVIDKWDIVELSIYFETREMKILGERIKKY